MSISSESSARLSRLFVPQKGQSFFNTRYKYYRINGKLLLAEVMTFEKPIFNPNGVEEPRKGKKSTPTAQKIDPWEDSDAQGDDDRVKRVAVNRARKKVFDYCANNPECNLFCTLTLDPKKIARTEWGEIIPKLSTWLDNRVRRNDLRYVLVPEYHKDGEAIHFHGIMNENALKVEESGLTDESGKPILNIVSWKYGFTTAKRIGESEADRVNATRYIAKYMTKDAERVGGRYFLHGGALKEPIYRYDNTDFEKAQGFDFAPCAGVRARIDTRI